MTVQPITVSLIATMTKQASWTALANGDTGQVLELNELTDNCIALAGTFGVGGSFSLEGSNDGTNYFVLHDPNGNAITLTAAGLKQILETPRYVRPHATAGDGTTALVPILVGRRGSR